MNNAPRMGRCGESRKGSDSQILHFPGLPLNTNVNNSRAPERAALRALTRAPSQSRRAWWTLYLALRRDREQAQRGRA